MNDKGYLYWILLMGWGLGQSINWLIGRAIGGRILTGDIGGVIHANVTIDLIIVGIGGLIGGIINGFLLSRALAIRFESTGFQRLSLVILLSGWAFAFMIREIVYRLAGASIGGLFHGISLIVALVLGNIIAATIGGTITVALFEVPLPNILVTILGWSLGLIVGFLTGLGIFNYLFSTFGFSASFNEQVAISNAVGGFINGGISAVIGGLIMVRILEKKNQPTYMENI